MIFELFHHAALLPLILLAVAVHRRQEPAPLLYWLVGTGLAISWVADSILELTGNPWLVTYLYPPLQAGLIFWGVARLETSEAVRRAVAAGLAVVALASMARGPLTEPEAVAQGLAALVVVIAIRRHHEMGLLRHGLLVYFGLGFCWWILWPITFGGPHFVAVYYGYQVTRMVGLALASVAMWRYRRHQLVLT